MDDWLLNHTGVPLTIYNTAELTGKTYPETFNPLNIIKGFKRTGISPYDPHISETDFLSSFVMGEKPGCSRLEKTSGKHEGEQQSSRLRLIERLEKSEKKERGHSRKV